MIPMLVFTTFLATIVDMSNKTLGVGHIFPAFEVEFMHGDLTGVMTEQAMKGSWNVFFTWPFDFTFVCPTELRGFNAIADKFADLDCNVFGMSIDSIFVHKEWVKSLELDVKFPLLSDVKRKLSKSLGILDEEVSGATYRATYIVDPGLVIRSIQINDLSVGRNATETLRLVQAFQTDKLCGCDWQPGEPTLN